MFAAEDEKEQEWNFEEKAAMAARIGSKMLLELQIEHVALRLVYLYSWRGEGVCSRE
jgi:hypothetical protein